MCTNNMVFSAQNPQSTKGSWVAGNLERNVTLKGSATAPFLQFFEPTTHVRSILVKTGALICFSCSTCLLVLAAQTQFNVVDTAVVDGLGQAYVKPFFKTKETDTFGNCTENPHSTHRAAHSVATQLGVTNWLCGLEPMIAPAPKLS